MRKWRFDFAFPKQKIAVEIEGVTVGMGGRQQRRSGLKGDVYKYNAAVLWDGGCFDTLRQW